MDEKYESLKLENQLCFPLYAASREIVNRYKTALDNIGLTYTQYITMLVMWEHKCISVRDMGKLLYLDSGTLTPVLKKLEQKGLVLRKRDSSDERLLNVTLTDEGLALREKAVDVPQQVKCTLNLSQEEAIFLYGILQKLLEK
ncbi:MAG: MarR family transcriptional regulator [Ruminococcus sp.]|nr:MarR family transcriptional regulator [Ruminococcus sp.]